MAIAALLATALPGGDVKWTAPPGLDAYLPTPEDNPLTPEKVVLGRDLFHDKRLSRDESISCATCHDPDRGFADDKPVAVGVQGRKGDRRTPTLINRGYGTSFFWDGRSPTLEDQVVKPIENPIEMDLTLNEAVARIGSAPEYRERFQTVFGREPNAQDLARALASYVRTIVAGDSPYDRYLAGDMNALSEQAREGLRLFRGKANCAGCHVGPNLTDERFHNTGAAWRDGKLTDAGRAKVTGNPEDQGAFKTPTLRNLTGRGPYMHNGSLAKLEDVIEDYDKGGTENPYLDPEMQPLKLTPEEKKALLAFLEALNGRLRDGIPD
ncbi:MAG: cytochrome-c peroxidase [Bryobacteraceae bacterium]